MRKNDISGATVFRENLSYICHELTEKMGKLGGCFPTTPKSFQNLNPHVKLGQFPHTFPHKVDLHGTDFETKNWDFLNICPLHR